MKLYERKIEMNIGAVIVTYNPDSDILKQNVSLLHSENVKIVLVDNNSTNINQFKNIKHIELVKETSNVGIAKALNDGVKFLNQRSVEWVVTLDQDSILATDYFKEFKYMKNDDCVAAYYPRIIDRNKNVKSMLEDDHELHLPIQSGAFLRVKDYYLAGGMDESLFIDGVDFDFFLTLLSMNKIIEPLKSTVLYHQLGNITEKSILGRHFFVTNHAPIRYFYNYRNMPVIIKRYKQLLSSGVVGKGYSSFFKYEYKRIIKMILAEQNRFEKIQFMFKGYQNRKKIPLQRKNYM